MTRETKIGLLIGLGFIVVFAVLLSHTSAPVPIVEPRPMAMGSGPGEALPSSASPVGNSRLPVGLSGQTPPAASWSSGPEPRQADGPQSMPAVPQERSVDPIDANPREVLAEAPSGGSERSPRAADPLKGLPRPVVLDGARQLAESVRSSASEQADQPVTTLADAQTSRRQNGVPARRVAPPRVVRPSVPEPADGAQAQNPSAEASEPQREAPAESQAQEYVVQKGDTVVKIVRANYGSASQRNIDFFVASNSDRIRDKHTIIAGQKLVIPQLPPELFEPAPEFDVSKKDGDRRTALVEQLAEAARQAPSVAPSEARRDTGGADAKVRLYEIKPNDTLAAIARRELGSSAYWKEIHKLNPDIDPRRMQPGTKIRLPAEPPVSESTGSRQERV